MSTDAPATVKTNLDELVGEDMTGHQTIDKSQHLDSYHIKLILSGQFGRGGALTDSQQFPCWCRIFLSVLNHLFECGNLDGHIGVKHCKQIAKLLQPFLHGQLGRFLSSQIIIMFLP